MSYSTKSDLSGDFTEACSRLPARLAPAIRHGIVSASGWSIVRSLFSFTAAAAFWPLFFAIAIAVAGLCCALLVALWVYDRERQAIFDYQRALRARAEYENWLWMRGDPRGFYGRYPPAVRIATAPSSCSGGGGDCTNHSSWPQPHAWMEALPRSRSWAENRFRSSQLATYAGAWGEAITLPPITSSLARSARPLISIAVRFGMHTSY